MDQGDYIGIELGADATADVNLDDFMVFDNDEGRAKTFFAQLLFAHFRSVAADEEDLSDLKSAPALEKVAFTQRNVFAEFVRATEGVPRDAVNIIGEAARKDFHKPISKQAVRKAAQTWYQRDKHPAVSANGNAADLLHKIIDDVIGHRQARAFLLRSDTRHSLIDELFDKRVLHLLKRSISAHDEPGVRYDVYKIDYGCYVDLLSTNRAPQGLLPAGEASDSYVNVPPDDYRAIRRAILDVSEL